MRPSHMGQMNADGIFHFTGCLCLVGSSLQRQEVCSFMFLIDGRDRSPFLWPSHFPILMINSHKHTQAQLDTPPIPEHGLRADCVITPPLISALGKH